MKHAGSWAGSPIQEYQSGIMPREDAMKLNPCALSNELNDESSGRKKKERDVANRIQAEIKAALDELDWDEARRAKFLSLLACVRAHTQLLKPTPGQGSAGWVAPVFLLGRLKNLAARQGLWLRPCESWRPQGSNLRSAFRSLALHLLALYPVPGCMDSV
jgi:hypothetical protein